VIPTILNLLSDYDYFFFTSRQKISKTLSGVGSKNLFWGLIRFLALSHKTSSVKTAHEQFFRDNYLNKNKN